MIYSKFEYCWNCKDVVEIRKDGQCKTCFCYVV